MITLNQHKTLTYPIKDAALSRSADRSFQIVLMLALQSTYIGFLNDEKRGRSINYSFTTNFLLMFVYFFSFGFDSVLIFINYDAFYACVTFTVVPYRPICNIAEKPGYIPFINIASVITS